MIRSDYRAQPASMPKLPGPLRLTPSFPFAGRARELATLRALIPRARRRGAAVRAGRRRGRLGQEPARARVRPRGGRATARSCSTAPATRSCGARTGRSSRRSTSSCAASTPRRCATDLGAEGGELSRLLPDLPQRVGELPAAGRRRPGHRAPPPAHGAVADLLAAVGARAPLVAGDRGRPLGRHADAAAAAPPRPRRAGRARAAGRPRSATPRPRSPRRCSATLADLRRSEGVVRLRLGGLSAEEIVRVRRSAPAAVTSSSRPAARSPGPCSELTGGNAFLMTELWRTLLESEPGLGRRRRVRLARRAGRARQPRGRARGRQPAARAARRRRPIELLELAAVAGTGVRPGGRSRRPARPTPSCARRSSRRSRTG